MFASGQIEKVQSYVGDGGHAEVVDRRRRGPLQQQLLDKRQRPQRGLAKGVPLGQEELDPRDVDEHGDVAA